jgi:TM2 domain-containing membrane protein YozV
MTSDKSWVVTILLCVFLGWLGVHRFYTGKFWTGLLFFLTGGFFFVGILVDFVMIGAGHFREKNGLLILPK